MFNDIYYLLALSPSLYIYVYISISIKCVCVLSHSVVSDSLRTYGLQPARFLCSWNFPGMNTEGGCHFLLQGICPIQELDPSLLLLLHWQGDSLPLRHLGSLYNTYKHTNIQYVIYNIYIYPSHILIEEIDIISAIIILPSICTPPDSALFPTIAQSKMQSETL